MDHPFPKTTSVAERYRKLIEIIGPDETLAILINADPDAMASALALKRIFWRRAKKVLIYRINSIQRADNLAMIKLLKIDQHHIRKLHKTEIDRWAIVDSQPAHDELFRKQEYDIIIDHHPVSPDSKARFMDIQESYGATSTIMTEYLRAGGIKISPRLATALFYGIKTDTENFIRSSTSADMNAFKYLYPRANLHIVKKIESSEITKNTLNHFRMAMENLSFYKETAFIYMDRVSNPDILVIISDFFLKLAEATWCIVSGVYGNRLIVIFRNVGFRRDAGKLARKLFGKWGSAGGHRDAARAEIPLKEIASEIEQKGGVKEFVLSQVRGI